MQKTAANAALASKQQQSSAFTLSFISAGFIAVLVGYSSAVAIVFQAAVAAGGSEQHLSSWLWALGTGMGISSIGLSWYYRKPIFTAWSTPGAALLVTSLPGFSLAEAVGAFLISSALMLLIALSGGLERLLRLLPPSLAGALLAGVLLQFGLQVFKGMSEFPVLLGAVLLAFWLFRQRSPRYVIPLVLMVGLLVSYVEGLLQWQSFDWQWPTLMWITPEFSWSATMSVAIPLCMVTMASQNVPGLAVLRANGYQAPASSLIATTSVTGLLLGGFGGFAFNLSAMTAAICQGEEAGGEPSQRYWATIWGGVFYLLAGLLGAALVTVLQMLPAVLVAAIAGLALLGPIANGLHAAMQEAKERDAALITFLVTASGVSLLGVGSAFWGLVAGLLALYGWRKAD